MRETFWEIACGALPAVVILFAINVVMLVFVGLSLPFVEPGSTAYYLNLISTGLILVVLGVCVFVIRGCRRRE